MEINSYIIHPVETALMCKVSIQSYRKERAEHGYHSGAHSSNWEAKSWSRVHIVTFKNSEPIRISIVNAMPVEPKFIHGNAFSS